MGTAIVNDDGAIIVMVLGTPAIKESPNNNNDDDDDDDDDTEL